MSRVEFKTKFRLDRYRNDSLIEWVSKSFRTELERAAAWAMFGHLCDEYQGVSLLVRGNLIETETSE